MSSEFEVSRVSFGGRWRHSGGGRGGCGAAKHQQGFHQFESRATTVRWFIQIINGIVLE